jgi:YjjG family noncanonical pyrimidine nucleotidase
MYKAIIFDLDNTLLNYSASELQCMQQTVAAHGLFEGEEDQWQQFWQNYLKINYQYWMSFVTKQSQHRSIQDVLIESFRDTVKVEEQQYYSLAHTYWQNFCDTCIYEQGANDVLHAVSSSYQLGIISNGIGAAQRKRLVAGNIDHLFQSIIVSDEIGIRKPNKEIFEAALEQLQLSPSEVLFVGDSLQDDYAGARNSGIDFCYYNRNRQELAERYKPHYRIDSLSQLLEVI